MLRMNAIDFTCQYPSICVGFVRSQNSSSQSAGPLELRVAVDLPADWQTLSRINPSAQRMITSRSYIYKCTCGRVCFVIEYVWRKCKRGGVNASVVVAVALSCVIKYVRYSACCRLAKVGICGHV